MDREPYEFNSMPIEGLFSFTASRLFSFCSGYYPFTPSQKLQSGHDLDGWVLLMFIMDGTDGVTNLDAIICWIGLGYLLSVTLEQ